MPEAQLSDDHSYLAGHCVSVWLSRVTVEVKVNLLRQNSGFGDGHRRPRPAITIISIFQLEQN